MTIRDIAVAFGFEVDKSSEKQAENSIKGIKNMATKLLGSIAVVFSVKGIAEFSKQCVSVASDVEEMQNKFDVVFQGMTDEVEDWAKTFADSIGRNKNDIKGYLADNQNMFVGMGMTRDAAAGLSEDLVSLSLDLASFNNLQEDQAVNAMSKAIMGESESAKTLGAVLNDNTRAMAMQEMGLSGTYQALDEATKMQVNYTAILMQSSDAVGDCARSLDSYKGRQIQLNSSIAELKEFIGSKLLPVFAKFLGYLNTGVKWLTSFAKKIFGATQEENRLLNAFERIHAIVKKLQPAIDRMMQTLSNGAKKGIEKLGGTENAMKLLSVVAGAFVVALNWSKIMKGAKAFLSIIKVIGKLLSPRSLGLLAAVAAIALLALIVEDFINFMKGNDSVIGYCFEKAGIDADEMRKKVKNIFTNLKKFFSGIWKAIKQAAEPILNAIKGMLENIFGEDLFAGIGEGVGAIIEFLDRITSALAENQGLQDFLGKAVVAIMAVVAAIQIAIPIVHAIIAVIGIAKGVIAAVGAVIGFLTSPIGLVIAAIAALIAVGVLMYKHWDEIKAFAASAWAAIKDAIGNAINSAKETIQTVLAAIWGFFSNIFSKVSSFVSTTFQNIASGISAKVKGIKDTIVNGFTAAINWIKELPSKALTWGSDIISGIVKGIKGAVGKVKDAVKGVADTIKSFLHFSVPDEGPLTDYESWMPDFMGGLAKGIKGNKGTVLNEVKELAGGISALTRAAVASPATASTSTVNNSTSSVIQNNNFNNSFTGGTAETQRNVSRAMKKSAYDATNYMAKGLSYARG